MCLTVTQKFWDCSCIVTRHLICSDHVDSTLKQLGNFPCLKIKNRSIEMLQGGCQGYSRCKNQRDTIWLFDHFSPAHFDFTFLEHPELSLESLQPTCLTGGFTKAHRCGIGRMVKANWRHLDENGDPIRPLGKNSKKEVKKEPTTADLLDDLINFVKEEVEDEVLEDLIKFVKKEAEDEDVKDDIEEEELREGDKDVEMIRKEVEMKL